MRNKIVLLLLICAVLFAGIGIVSATVQNKQSKKEVPGLPTATLSQGPVFLIGHPTVQPQANSQREVLSEQSENQTENPDLPQSNVAISQSVQGTQAVVTRVVDGDTIDVSFNGSSQRVRLIGINAPETVDPKKPVQCYGPQASDEMKSLVSGKTVFLQSDSSQTDRDKYNRLLRYVFLSDGTDVDLVMIQEGFAYEYTYKIPYEYQSEFLSAQADAKAQGKGLWSACQ